MSFLFQALSVCLFSGRGWSTQPARGPPNDKANLGPNLPFSLPCQCHELNNGSFPFWSSGVCITCNSHSSQDFFSLENFLRLSLSFVPLTVLRSISLSYCRVRVFLIFSPDQTQFMWLGWNATKRMQGSSQGTMSEAHDAGLSCHWWSWPSSPGCLGVCQILFRLNLLFFFFVIDQHFAGRFPRILLASCASSDLHPSVSMDNSCLKQPPLWQLSHGAFYFCDFLSIY